MRSGYISRSTQFAKNVPIIPPKTQVNTTTSDCDIPTAAVNIVSVRRMNDEDNNRYIGLDGENISLSNYATLWTIEKSGNAGEFTIRNGDLYFDIIGDTLQARKRRNDMYQRFNFNFNRKGFKIRGTSKDKYVILKISGNSEDDKIYIGSSGILPLEKETWVFACPY